MAERVGRHLGNDRISRDGGMDEVATWLCIPQLDHLDRLAALVSEYGR